MERFIHVFQQVFQIMTMSYNTWLQMYCLPLSWQKVFCMIELEVSMQIYYSAVTGGLMSWQKINLEMMMFLYGSLWFSLYNEIWEIAVCSVKDARRLPQVLQNIMHYGYLLGNKAQPMSRNTTSVLYIPVPTRHLKCDSNTPQLNDFVVEERPETTLFHMFS